MIIIAITDVFGLPFDHDVLVDASPASMMDETEAVIIVISAEHAESEEALQPLYDRMQRINDDP